MLSDGYSQLLAFLHFIILLLEVWFMFTVALDLSTIYNYLFLLIFTPVNIEYLTWDPKSFPPAMEHASICPLSSLLAGKKFPDCKRTINHDRNFQMLHRLLS